MKRKARWSFLKLAIKLSIYATVSLATVFLYFFGTSILENEHLSYLRYKMKDTVLIRNLAGSGGTGWVTTLKSGKTIVITNAHVCGLAVDNQVIVNYRGLEYIQEVIKKYPKHDLCAITAPEGVTGGYSIASDVKVGEAVYTLGHPYLEPNTITKGELSGLYKIQILVGYNMSKEECSDETYELIPVNDPTANMFGIDSACVRVLDSQSSSVSILPGNSGSCTVNIYGDVVAVAFAGNEGGTRSYHVPLAALQDFLGSLE